MKNIRLLLLLTLFALLASCGSEECLSGCDERGENCTRECGECVEGDDWGYPKIIIPAGTHDVANVPSDVNNEESRFHPNAHTTGLKFVPGKDQYGNQEVVPIDSGQILINANHSPLVITVDERSEWTAWFNGRVAPPSNTTQIHPETGKKITRECVYDITKGAETPLSSTTDQTTRDNRLNTNKTVQTNLLDDLSPTVRWAKKNNENETFNILDETLNTGTDDNPVLPYGESSLDQNKLTPCFLKHGMGLYVGLLPNDATGDGSNSIYTYHIPDQKAPGMDHDDFNPNIDTGANPSFGDPVKDGYLVKGMPSQELPGAETNDRLYFKILDRFYDDNAGEYVVKIKEGTKSASSGPIETIANTILTPLFAIMERLYKGIINNIGFVNLVRASLVLYIVFYGFSMMIGTIQDQRKEAFMKVIKLALVVQVISPDSWDFFYNNLFKMFVEGVGEIAGLLLSPFSNYDPSSPWYSMDQLLAKLFSSSTFAKISSTLFSNSAGIVFIIALYYGIILFLFTLMRALVIYMVGFIGIAMLVVMAPIFIVFILFDATKDLFKEWITQIIAISIQQIMLLAFLGMFSAVILYFLERNLGYNVCWNIWFKFSLFGHDIFDFRYWMPTIGSDLANLWVDADQNGVREVNEFATRYIDLPYFDPLYDKDLIAKYERERNFLELIDIGVFVILIYLMRGFIEFIPAMIASLQSGQGGDSKSGSMFDAGTALANSMGRAVGAGLRFLSAADQGFGAGQIRADILNIGKDKDDKTRVRAPGISDYMAQAYKDAHAGTQGIKLFKGIPTSLKDIQDIPKGIGGLAYDSTVGLAEKGIKGAKNLPGHIIGGIKGDHLHHGYKPTKSTPHGEEGENLIAKTLSAKADEVKDAAKTVSQEAAERQLEKAQQEKLSKEEEARKKAEDKRKAEENEKKKKQNNQRITELENMLSVEEDERERDRMVAEKERLEAENKNL